jgi:hypothetical protein
MSAAYPPLYYCLHCENCENCGKGDRGRRISIHAREKGDGIRSAQSQLRGCVESPFLYTQSYKRRTRAVDAPFKRNLTYSTKMIGSKIQSMSNRHFNYVLAEKLESMVLSCGLLSIRLSAASMSHGHVELSTTGTAHLLKIGVLDLRTRNRRNESRRKQFPCTG